MVEAKEKQWMPLEGNPDIFNEFAHKLGFSTGLYKFIDIYSLDADSWINLVPQPVIGVILLYTIKDEHNDFIKQVSAAHDSSTEAPFFTKQKIRNACGTIALIHCLMNSTEYAGQFQEGSFLDKFMISSLGQTADETAKILIESEDLEAIHKDEAKKGHTQPPETQVKAHFVTYVEKGGQIWELDGRRDKPINHGVIEGANLGVKAGSIIQKYIEMDKTSVEFSVMALCACD